MARRPRDLIALAGVWAPPLALMGVIFFFSAQPDLSSGLGVLDLIGRKIIHATEYGLLALLWWRALRTVTSAQRALWYSLAVTVAYAASEEFHQSFVTGRHGTPVDVAIDTAGAVLALALVRARSLEGGRRG